MGFMKKSRLRLTAAEKTLYRKLSGEGVIEIGGVIWQPPGWLGNYWKKGLWFRRADDGEAVRFAELGDEGLHEMMAKFDEFVDYVRQEWELDIEPSPA